MKHPMLIPILLCVAGAGSAQQQAQPKANQQTQAPLKPPMTVTTVPGVNIKEAVPVTGTNRFYYTTRDNELSLYDPASQKSTLVARGDVSEPSLSPKHDRIAFGRGTEANAKDLHIWAMPLDPATGAAGGPARRVSVMAGHAPSFSPDGQQIAFAAKDSAGAERVAVVPVAGGVERIVDSTARVIELIRWSRDAKSLYVGDWGWGKSYGAFHVRLEGGPATLIAEIGSSSPGPSPDGRLTAMTDGRGDSLFVTGADGKRLGWMPWPGSWDVASWNGSTHLFVPKSAPHRLRAYSMADGSTKPMGDSTVDIREMHWSPDSRRIAIVDMLGKISVMNADGTGRKFLRRGFFIVGCDWSPDGKHLLIATNEGQAWKLTSVEIATGREVVVVPNWHVPAFLFQLETGRWGADSKSVYYPVFIAAIPGDVPGNRYALHEATLDGKDRVIREMEVFRTPPQPFFAKDVMNMGTRDGRRVNVPLRESSDEVTVMPASYPKGWVSGPSFSTDGARVAFRINPSGLDRARMTRIEVVHADGTQRTAIELPFNALPGFHNPSFFPDSPDLLIAGTEKRGGPITFYRATPDGKSIKAQFTMPWPQTLPFPDYSFELSPDGKTLLYLTDEPNFSTITDIDLSALLTRAPAKKAP